MYMKKIFLPILMLLGAFISQAQVCVPGTLTGTGAYYIVPDSATNFVDACQGQAYSQIMYIKAPKDTIISITNPINATLKANIDSFVIDANIVGMPTYLSAASVPALLLAAPPNPKTNLTRLIIKGDSLACVNFSGNVPGAAMTGTNPLLINVRAYLSGITAIGASASFDPLIPGLFPGRKVDTPIVLNDYRIIVNPSPCAPAGVTNLIKHQFSLVGCVPNPIESSANILFESIKIDNFTLKIMNALGEVVENRIIQSNYGLNYIPLNMQAWSRGTYMYSLTDGKHIYSNKLQLK